MSTPASGFLSSAAQNLTQRLLEFLRSRRGHGQSSQVEAEYLRAIYRNMVFNTPISFAMVLYLISQSELGSDIGLYAWGVVFNSYLFLRWVASLLYPKERELETGEVRVWSALSVLIQGCNGVLISYLALFLLPKFDLYSQVVAVMVVLILVGATAFSLSGRWIDTIVYAPPVYLSMAWTVSNQAHPYAHGVSLLVLGLFALHLAYASNHRKTIIKSFVIARNNAGLARELQLKNIEFQELAGARSRLLATVSHDLRQPAHAIGLLSEQALASDSFEQVKSRLRDLNELSQSLSASLTTLMDLTRLDAGLVQARITDLSLSQVMGRLEAEFGPSARSKGLELSFSVTPCWVRSDPVLLHGVLSNLISNAIKYTRQGRIDVVLGLEKDRALVEVIDTGIGIEGDKLELIFREFVRLDASDSGAEGLGLGLSIVRRYAALLSHPLSVRSEPGKGSCFGVWLTRVEAPIQTAEPAAKWEPAASVNPLEGLHVLVVENVELLLMSLKTTLAAWGCQTHLARNMVEALEAADRQWPDLVVSDHHLGDREPSGIELIIELKARALGRPPPPALIMTGDVSAQIEARARECGAQVLHKPVRPAVLQNSMLELLGRTGKGG